MQIAIVGYGKMGKRIEQIAVQRGHTICQKINYSNRKEIETIGADCVAIEFTNPDSVLENLRNLAKSRVTTVSGTTGWNNHEKQVFGYFKKSETPFFYASNFSVGVHIFRRINQLLAQAMHKFPEYEAEINEWHHTEKKDSPSGTAISLGNDLIEANGNYTSLSRDKKPAHKELGVFGHRQAGVTGKHTVNYHSRIDQITIAHEAFNRDGFALGAVMAAEFIKGQQAGIFTMNDLIKLDE